MEPRIPTPSRRHWSVRPVPPMAGVAPRDTPPSCNLSLHGPCRGLSGTVEVTVDTVKVTVDTVDLTDMSGLSSYVELMSMLMSGLSGKS